MCPLPALAFLVHAKRYYLVSRRSPAPTDDEIGIWSDNIKHNLLRRYLPARRTVMHSYRRSFPGGDHYVDGFVGSGIAKIRGEDRYVDGSPRIALDVPHPFDYYWFNERDPTRRARLRNLVDAYPDHGVRLLGGDCNEIIIKQITPIVRAERFARGFAFLDPFGMNLHWETVEAVADTGAMETIINLCTMGLSRVGLPNAVGGPNQEQIELMNRVFGTPDWQREFYELQPDLWGERQTVKKTRGTAQRLGEIYKERLETVFPHVSSPLVVTNTKGQPIYCLLFAGPNATGLKIAQAVLRKLELASLSVIAPSPAPKTLPLQGLS
jgi:three-Cys-motif partner protein